MELNGIAGRAAFTPLEPSVVPAPAPVARTPAGRPGSTAPVDELDHQRGEERVQSAPDSLAAQQAADARAGTRLRVDDDTERIVAQIVNADNEVIKQIPPEELLKVISSFRRVIGVLFDQRV